MEGVDDPAEHVVRLLRSPAAAAPLVPGACWPAVVEAAERLDVAPLLARRLKPLGPAGPVPADAAALLAARYRDNLVRNHRIYAELAEIGGALAARGVEFLALKGAHLAAAVYPDLGSRQLSDIDLLVRPGALPAAAEAMRGLGYAAPAAGLAGIEAGGAHHLPGFTRPGRATVELHWRLGGEAPPADELWPRAAAVATPRGEVRGLGPEDLLLHLALHAGRQHGFRIGLRPWHDIALTIGRHAGALDWAALAERGLAGGSARWLGLAFRLARDLAGAEVPQATLDALGAGDAPADVVGIARRRVLTERPASGLAERAAALLPEAPLAGLGIAAARVLLPRAAVAELYAVAPGSWRLWLAYPRRLRDLAVRHGPLLARWLLGRPSARAVVGREARLLAWAAGGDRPAP